MTEFSNSFYGTWRENRWTVLTRTLRRTGRFRPIPDARLAAGQGTVAMSI